MTVVIRFAWHGTSTSPCTPTFANLLASLLSCGRYTLHALPRHVCPESLASTYRPRWRCATCHTAYVTKAFRINRIRHPHPFGPSSCRYPAAWLNGNLVELHPQNRSSNRGNAFEEKVVGKTLRSFFLPSLFDILTWMNRILSQKERENEFLERKRYRRDRHSCYEERCCQGNR